jgi:5-formyltetrahydrofolate cyclo-ligase
MMSAPPSLADQKAQLRAEALARRDALPADMRAGAAEAIAAHAFPIAVKPGTIVAGFMPMKSEINPLPLMRKLADAGAQLALPAIAGRGQPLIMRAYKTGDACARRSRSPPSASPSPRRKSVKFLPRPATSASTSC